MIGKLIKRKLHSVRKHTLIDPNFKSIFTRHDNEQTRSHGLVTTSRLAQSQQKQTTTQFNILNCQQSRRQNQRQRTKRLQKVDEPSLRL